MLTQPLRLRTSSQHHGWHTRLNRLSWFFELFLDFARIAAAVTRTGISEHQATNRTKMHRGDERSETDDDPAVLSGRIR